MQGCFPSGHCIICRYGFINGSWIYTLKGRHSLELLLQCDVKQEKCRKSNLISTQLFCTRVFCIGWKFVVHKFTCYYILCILRHCVLQRTMWSKFFENGFFYQYHIKRKKHKMDMMCSHETCADDLTGAKMILASPQQRSELKMPCTLQNADFWPPIFSPTIKHPGNITD